MHMKGQIWYLDIMFALSIFTVALVFFFKADINFLDKAVDTLEDMDLEAGLLSDSLMSPGYPAGWDTGNVIEIGLTKKNRINETKLDYLGMIEYNLTKTKFRTKYDYYIVFEDIGGIEWINSTNEGIGKPGINSTNLLDSDPDHLIKIVRFVIFKSDAKRMVVYLWQ